MRRTLTLLLAGAAVLAGPPAAALARRPIPTTLGAVHVWNDQLPDDMSDAQVRFVASHSDGTQKVSRATAERLRAVDPGFLVLHYRLGIGDGPVPFRIGTRWASDFSSVTRHESWFWHSAGRRVLRNQDDWYVMNPASPWRGYWARRVRYEAGLLDDDGVFADSLSVPQYLGATGFTPPFRYFVGEAAWTARIDRFMRYEERALAGRLWFIPNAGSWITTRDRTDYSIPDGVMIEGFGLGGSDGYYATGDWSLQMDRVLGLARLGRILICQAYPRADDAQARGFLLASYLLVQGPHSFLNMDAAGIAAQWFPEYSVDLGPPASGPAPDVTALRQPGGVYVRRFARGLVAVNPDAQAHTLQLDSRMNLVTPHGGGALDGAADTSGWGLSTRPVSGTLQLAGHSGAVLTAP